MHINQLNPRVLRKQLARCFPNVLLWFGEPSDMGGSLLRPFSRQQLAGARDLCAVASKNPIDVEQLRCRLQSVPLPPVALRELHLAAGEPPRAVYVDEEFTLEIKLDNRTPVVFGSSYPNPVVVSYRWMLPDGRVAVADGLRSAIKPPMVPGHHRSIPARIAAPARPGTYVLRVTLVQEGVQWFDSPEIGVFRDLSVSVWARLQ